MNRSLIWFFSWILLLLPVSTLLASTEPNASSESEAKEILQQMVNNNSVSTLDSIKSIINDSQNLGVLGRLAKCGATMQNMTEEQHQCIDNMAMGLEGLR
jgi:Na+/serine symporter